MQHGDISSIKFHKALQKVNKYSKIKPDIRNQAKTKVKQITKQKREELLDQKVNVGNFFFKKIENNSGIQAVNAKYDPPPMMNFMTRVVVMKISKVFPCDIYYQQQNL